MIPFVRNNQRVRFAAYSILPSWGTGSAARLASRWAVGSLPLWFAAQPAYAQVLQQYLPDISASSIGQAGAAIAPDVTATPRGAAEIQPDDTVTTRIHPEYTSRGMHVGDFYVQPSLTEGSGYNSNLFTDKSGRGAFQITTTPGLSFASDWSRNAIQGSFQLNNTIYPSQRSQNFTNFIGNLGGNYDIGRDQLRVQYTHGSLHIARGSIDAGNFDRPIQFQYDNLHLGYLIPFARVSFEPAIDLSTFRFENGTFNGLPQIQTNNNRNAAQAMLTTRYELAPLRNLVLVVSGLKQNYTSPQVLQPTRNSKSVEILGGIDFNLNALFRLRVLMGYEQRTFTSSTFSTRSAPIIDADVIWTPTELTTVTTSINRSIEDGLSTDTTGFTYTSAKISVDHELRRNVLLNGHTQVQMAEFSNNLGTQDIYSVGGSVAWRLNRNLSLTGSYDYATRQASAAQGISYSQNIVLLGFSVKQ